MKWVIGLLVAAALVAVGFWAYGAIGVPKVVVATPERRDAIRAIFATGSVKAEQMARIRSEVAGQVLQVHVRQGEEIRQGDPVMEIKVEEQNSAVVEQQSRLREAQVTVSETKLNLGREQELLAQGASTQQAVDNARAAYNRASAFYNSARAVLSARKSLSGKGKVVAPITGIVTEVNVNPGDVIPANVEAVTILDPSTFRVIADVDELDITRIRPGQEAIVAFDALPKSRFRARVDRIIPQADEVTRTLPVILVMTDAMPNLSDGLTATVNIIQERHPDALTIPSRAIFNEQGTNVSVFVVNDHNLLELRVLKIGVRGEDYVEILEGIKEDDRLVLDPNPEWEPQREVLIDKERMRDAMKNADR